jgi:hypothetical protein
MQSRSAIHAGEPGRSSSGASSHADTLTVVRSVTSAAVTTVPARRSLWITLWIAFQRAAVTAAA